MPIPDNGQQIVWNANFNQIGRGASKITLDGVSGIISTPKMVCDGELTAGSIKINNNAVVDVATNQTITGQKTHTNSLFVKRNSMNVQLVPTTDAQPAEIAFFQKANLDTQNTGDLWAIGRGSWGVGDGNLGIGCNTAGKRITVTPTHASIHSDLYLDNGANLSATGRIMVGHPLHSIIFRGDVPTGTGYNPGVVGNLANMTFIEYGASWRFRKITETENNLILHINETELQYMGMPLIRRLPTGVVPATGYTVTNLPTNCFYELSINGYCGNQSQLWILCNDQTENNIWMNKRDVGKGV